jgi:hypothetical protein
MSLPWRYECPDGHRWVRENTGDPRGARDEASEFYCETCGTGYSEGEIRDLAVEFGSKTSTSRSH